MILLVPVWKPNESYTEKGVLHVQLYEYSSLASHKHPFRPLTSQAPHLKPPTPRQYVDILQVCRVGGQTTSCASWYIVCLIRSRVFLRTSVSFFNPEPAGHLYCIFGSLNMGPTNRSKKRSPANHLGSSGNQGVNARSPHLVIEQISTESCVSTNFNYAFLPLFPPLLLAVEFHLAGGKCSLHGWHGFQYLPV